MSSDEVTALCPVTGQPDYYTVRIEFGPDGVSLESKSLKLYLQKFRNMGIFAEDLSSTIAQDTAKVLSPEWLTVTVIQKSRGGVTLSAVSHVAPSTAVTVGAVQTGDAL